MSQLRSSGGNTSGAAEPEWGYQPSGKLVSSSSGCCGPSVIFHLSHPKRLLILFTLFAFYIVQLAIYQSRSNKHSLADNPHNAAFLVAVNVLLVVVTLVTLCCGWVFRPFFEDHAHYANALLFGLSFGWLILAAPFASTHLAFYVINSLIVVFLIVTDVWAVLWPYPSAYPVQSLRSSAAASTVSHRRTGYGKLGTGALAEREAEEDSVVGESDVELALRERETEREKERELVIRGVKVDVTDRAICEGFRVNFSRIPLPAATEGVRRDLSWEDFMCVTHIVDSSSCHIYTALWAGTPVVVKLIKAERLSSPVAVAEFEIEESVLSRIAHPHVIRLLGSGSRPRKFLVLELLAGGSLAHALGIRENNGPAPGPPSAALSVGVGGVPTGGSEGGPAAWFQPVRRRKFSLGETLRLSLSLAQALRYLHHEWSDSVHVIHRDLKPDNIGFTAEGQLKLFDFGLCATVRHQRDRSEQYRLTGNTGTLRYMAPEVVLGRGYNQSVDVYSFGILVWQIATGKVPFREMGKKTFFDKVVVGGQRLRIEPNWPSALGSLLRACWHEDKLQRPTFKQVCVELEALVKAEDDLQRVKRSRLDRRCMEGLAPWVRPLVLLSLCCVFIASLITVVHRDDTVVGAVLGALSSFGIYALLMQMLRSAVAPPAAVAGTRLSLSLASAAPSVPATDYEYEVKRSPTAASVPPSSGGSVLVGDKRQSGRGSARKSARERDRERVGDSEAVEEGETEIDVEAGRDVAFNPLTKVKQRGFGGLS